MLHKIEAKQFIRSDLETVWNFISSPKNLSKITPAHMGFHILDDSDISVMYPGQIIEYHVSPVAGIKMNWVTEITHVKEKEFFVDEQRFGPYAFWHHKHFIKEVQGGVEMLDTVHYKAPFGIIGKMVNSLFIKKQLKVIFAYRYQKMEELFNS